MEGVRNTESERSGQLQRYYGVHMWHNEYVACSVLDTVSVHQNDGQRWDSVKAGLFCYMFLAIAGPACRGEAGICN